ncbi:Bleomycin hydrolase, partial [Operophtera brumata]
NDFYSEPKNELAQNACTRFDPFEVAISRKRADSSLHVETEGKPVTNQENSGRCWLFAALNVMRLPVIQLEEELTHERTHQDQGTPPDKFNFEYYNKEKAYNSFGPLTPQNFYNEHVRPLFNVDDKVCLVSDPRESNPFGKLYTLQCLGNVVGGRQTAYNNQPIETLINSERSQGAEPVRQAVHPAVPRERGGRAPDCVQQPADRDAYQVSILVVVSDPRESNPFGKLYTLQCLGNVTRLPLGVQPGRSNRSLKSTQTDVWRLVHDACHGVHRCWNRYAVVLPAWDPMGTLACPQCAKE